MSLLLEALKKAERAKEEAQRRARAEGAEEAAAPAPAEPARKPVLTRDKLPDISTPLEILSDDLSPPPPPKPAARPEPVLEPLDAPAAPKPATRATAAKPAASKPPDEQAASRASAKKVFEAKFREPNPKMPFYITMGALGIFALGTVGYFWYQLRPPPALVNANPARQAEAAAAADASTPPPAPSAPTSGPAAIPGLPPTAAKSTPPSAAPGAAPAAATPTAPRQVVETPPEAPRLRPAQRIAEPRSAPSSFAGEASASVTRAPPQVNPRVEAGYTAYTAGDLATARSEYEQALRDEPTNRDALLGLAALDVRSGRYESAEALYLRVLQIAPRDPQAQAALFLLRSGRSDPLATESRVKTLLATDPSAHALNFALGNQLAQQNRWAEAQQEYFKAYTAEPENADFAYNLAVSLDHLRQPRQALDYYQRAIGLSEKRGASFDLGAAKTRAAQLAR